MEDHFETFIGQHKVKKALNFRLQAYKKNKLFRPTLLSSERGSGKTELCRRICRALGKVYVEVNGASIQKVGGFVDDVVIPHVQGDREVTIFIDEIHAADKKFLTWMLSVIAPNRENRTRASHNGLDFEFDFKRVAFLFATTNAEKLGIAFNERPLRYEFSEYTASDLASILQLNCPDVEFAENVLPSIVSIGRDSPRGIVRIANDINEYATTYEINYFGKRQWEELSDIMSFYPLGLTPKEISVLKRLNEYGEQTLRGLASALSMESGTIQKDIEPYLLKKGLMLIDVKRAITVKGQRIVNSIKL